MYNLQIVQGKDIKNDEYEGSLLQDTRDLAWYNITEGSEIVYERIILPKFQQSAKYYEKRTAIEEYLKYRFGDISKVKKIHSYYSEQHRQQEKEKYYSKSCSVTTTNKNINISNKISSDHRIITSVAREPGDLEKALQTSNSNNSGHSQYVRNSSNYSADNTSNHHRSNDDHIHNKSSSVNNYSVQNVHNSIKTNTNIGNIISSDHSNTSSATGNSNNNGNSNKNGRYNSKPNICFHFRDHGWCPHGAKCYYYH
jgi:hypothetical protein